MGIYLPFIAENSNFSNLHLTAVILFAASSDRYTFEWVFTCTPAFYRIGEGRTIHLFNRIGARRAKWALVRRYVLSSFDAFLHVIVTYLLLILLFYSGFRTVHQWLIRIGSPSSIFRPNSLINSSSKNGSVSWVCLSFGWMQSSR